MTAYRSTTADRHRDGIVAAAAQLLTEGGREAVSTRAVSVAAGVQSPVIYRLFGDKQGLLDAVATHGFMTYLDNFTVYLNRETTLNPVEDLRVGWNMHLSFGLANPYLYSLAYGDARPGASTPAADAAKAYLTALVHRVAGAGRLKMAEDHAVELLHAVCCGTVFTLIATPEGSRDLTLADLTRELIFAAVITDAAPVALSGPVGAAVHLRAVLPETPALTANERDLLQDWLDRIANPGTDGAANRPMTEPRTDT